MSTYENYHQTSQVYDKTRSAGGVKIIRNALAENKLPLEKQILLMQDAVPVYLRRQWLIMSSV